MRKMKAVKVINSVKFTGYGPDWWNYPEEWNEQVKRMLEQDKKHGNIN